MKRFWLMAVAVAGSLAAQNTYENLNAVTWVQHSAEYRAVTMQTYRAAEANLLRALADSTWTAALEQMQPATALPPAVILDLDETVLDNSAFQARSTALHTAFTDVTWGAWVKEARAGLIPGAAQFLATAHAHGVAIFYVTNRVCEPGNAGDPTVTVVRRHNLPFDPKRLLCRTESGDKSPRRALVAQNYRVLLLVGDDYNDFLIAGSSADARNAAIAPYERYFGERWFMVPNPTYGSWERAVGATVKEKLGKLRQ
ncbi:MAG: HAD family acid phosphatase [Bryobacteraceae bacterium]|nr:HAD family acid phosphatase [Bryobacteraceae bacterium]